MDALRYDRRHCVQMHKVVVVVVVVVVVFEESRRPLSDEFFAVRDSVLDGRFSFFFVRFFPKTAYAESYYSIATGRILRLQTKHWQMSLQGQE